MNERDYRRWNRSWQNGKRYDWRDYRNAHRQVYHLPPSYGPYRWVRYYDDALLVNLYSGEAVDAIYDMFW